MRRPSGAARARISSASSPSPAIAKQHVGVRSCHRDRDVDEALGSLHRREPARRTSRPDRPGSPRARRAAPGSGTDPEVDSRGDDRVLSRGVRSRPRGARRAHDCRRPRARWSAGPGPVRLRRRPGSSPARSTRGAGARGTCGRWPGPDGSTPPVGRARRPSPCACARCAGRNRADRGADLREGMGVVARARRAAEAAHVRRPGGLARAASRSRPRPGRSPPPTGPARIGSDRDARRARTPATPGRRR